MNMNMNTSYGTNVCCMTNDLFLNAPPPNDQIATPSFQQHVSFNFS